MCGIAGIFATSQQTTIHDDALWAMAKKIIHRGPDAQDIWSAEGIGLAHTRLSIIDLDVRSNQPLMDPDTGNVIVFNGEIYNYIEIRQELISAGYHFRTQSDTEVILKAYDHWGVNCLNKFNGMWAFAIYSAKERKLFAARDRFGIKPFIYGINKAGDLVFASEAKAIVPLHSEFKAPNYPFLFDFVESDFFACYKETFYKGLFNLLPGHYFIIEHGEQPRQIRFWNWLPSQRDVIKSDKDIAEEFETILQDSIRLRFRSDVPVGACLSGGLDSPTVVGMATKIFSKQVKTFSCIYPDLPNFDESQYIKQIVTKFKTDPHYIVPTYDDLIATMYSSTYEQDGPTGGPSILSQRAVMSLASSKVKVLLDGQGADEAFGGYHGYYIYSLLARVRELRKSPNALKWLTYLLQTRQIKKRVGSLPTNFKNLWLNANNPINFAAKKIEQTQLHHLAPDTEDHLNTILLEHVFTNLTNLLHYEDRNSMTFSIESRLPYLDYRLIEFAFALPHSYKIRGKLTKWLIYQTSKKLLPKTVLKRKDKMGFTTPGHHWLQQGDNLKYLSQYMHPNNEIFNNVSPYMQGFLQDGWNNLSQKNADRQASAGEVNALWRYFTANMWLETMGS